MTKIELDKLMRELSFSAEMQIQKEAKEKLINQINQLDIDYFLSGPKSCWHNQIEVLSYASRAQFISSAAGFVRRLQDINWPGTDELMRLIFEKLPLEFLVDQLEIAAKIAILNSDEEWIYGIASFMDAHKISFDSIKEKEVRLKLLESKV